MEKQSNLPKSQTVLPKSLPFPQIDQIDLDHDHESCTAGAKRMKGATNK